MATPDTKTHYAQCGIPLGDGATTLLHVTPNFAVVTEMEGVLSILANMKDVRY